MLVAPAMVANPVARRCAVIEKPYLNSVLGAGFGGFAIRFDVSGFGSCRAASAGIARAAATREELSPQGLFQRVADLLNRCERHGKREGGGDLKTLADLSRDSRELRSSVEPWNYGPISRGSSTTTGDKTQYYPTRDPWTIS